jgi:hypothetical protein
MEKGSGNYKKESFNNVYADNSYKRVEQQAPFLKNEMRSVAI